MTPHVPDPLAAGHDIDGIPPGATPRRSVVVCATPGIHPGRIFALLQHCGAGIPMEYFDIGAVAAPLARRWRVLDLDEYVKALHHHRTTADGVFGVTLQWSHLRRLHHQVAGATQLTAERTMPLIARIAPSAQFVFVHDASTDTQAVRLTMQRATGDATPTPRDVAACLTLIEATRHTWRKWFDDAGIEPVTLAVGEGSVFDPSPAELAAILGLEPPADTGPTEPALSRAGQDLLRRFRADRADGVLEIEELVANEAVSSRSGR